MYRPFDFSQPQQMLAHSIQIDRRADRAQYQRMTGASVGRLWHFPVKSMRGEEVHEVLLGPGGVVGDRAYGFLDVQTAGLVSAKRPERYGTLLECRARFSPASGRCPQSPPRADTPTPPIEVTFPDGTVVRDDEAELTRRTAALLGRELRLVTSAPEGVGLDELWPKLEGFGPDAVRGRPASSAAR